MNLFMILENTINLIFEKSNVLQLQGRPLLFFLIEVLSKLFGMSRLTPLIRCMISRAAKTLHFQHNQLLTVYPLVKVFREMD